jgi:putative spermidine/putrescine transport system permease protein
VACAGAIASFLLSMDNISLSLFITRNDTLPLRLMQHMLSYTDPSVAAMSVMLLLISLALLPFIARGQLD